MIGGDRTAGAPPTTAGAAENWPAQFREQYDAETRKTLAQFAASRTRWLAQNGIPVDSELAADLLQDAIVSTLSGATRWDPDAVPLVVHLHALTRSRTSKICSRRSVAATSLDGLDEETLCQALERDWTDGPLTPEDQLDQQRRGAAAGELVRALRGLARGDHDVQRLLTALHQGATTAADLLHATRLSRNQLTDAQRRLETLVMRVPADLRRAAGYGDVPTPPRRDANASLDVAAERKTNAARTTAAVPVRVRRNRSGVASDPRPATPGTGAGRAPPPHLAR